MYKTTTLDNKKLLTTFCHIEEEIDVKIPFIHIMYIQNTYFSLGNYLRTSLIIGNLMIIRVTSVEWTWLG